MVYDNEDIVHIYDIKLNKNSKSIKYGYKLSSIQFSFDN